MLFAGLFQVAKSLFLQGCDYHPGFQQIAFVDTETGALRERRLTHPEEAEQIRADYKPALSVRFLHTRLHKTI